MVENTYWEENENKYYEIQGFVAWLVAEIEGGIGYSDAEVEEMQSDLASARSYLRAF